MFSLIRGPVLAAAIIAAQPVAHGYVPFQSNQNKEHTGSISGRVTLAEKPAAGVTVLLAPAEQNAPLAKPVARATTDEDGRFQLTRVPAGSYLIQTFTPAFVGPSSRDWRRPGKSVNLNDGETVDGIDIALIRGGAITGRITNAEGQPLIQEPVRLFALTDRGQKVPAYLPYGSYFSSTDDRGVYRLYGVPPGRYVVAAGTDPTQNFRGLVLGNNPYTLTFHPDVTDQSNATIIEVASGGEITGIDITLGGMAKAYSAAGRIINAETGKPVPGMSFGYGSLQPNGTNFGSYSSSSGLTSNQRGEFRIEGITPGRYAAFATTTARGETDLYSDPALFEVTDADIAGLEIKLHRGSSLSGVVIVESTSDVNGAPKLSEVSLGVSVSSLSLTSPYSNQIKTGPDGSFRTAGLQPGSAHFFLMTYPPPKGLSLVRVERDGVEQTGGVEIRAGEQVLGVKVILGYGTGIIRGKVSLEGGDLPEGTRFGIGLYRAGKPLPLMPVEADVRGRFVFEGLLPGEYEVSLTAIIPPLSGPQVRPGTVKQPVSVANGAETQVTLTVDLSGKK